MCTALYDVTEDSIPYCFIMLILSESPRIISELRGYEAGTVCSVPPTPYLPTLPRKPAISVKSVCTQKHL